MRNNYLGQNSNPLGSRHTAGTYYGSSQKQHAISLETSNGKASHGFNGSQRTEPAFAQGNIPLQNELSRKHSDFSFASGQKSGMLSSGRSPAHAKAAATAVAAYSAVVADEDTHPVSNHLRQRSEPKTGGHNNQLSAAINLNPNQLTRFSDMNSQSARTRKSAQKNLAPSGGRKSGNLSYGGSAGSSQGSLPRKHQQMHPASAFHQIDEESSPSSQHDYTDKNQYMPLSGRNNPASTSGAGNTTSGVASQRHQFSGGLCYNDSKALSQQQNGVLSPEEYQNRNNYMPFQKHERQSSAQNTFSESQSSPYRVHPTLGQIKLENATKYAELCEKRILELQPNHSLPVLEEHLGTGNPFIEDLKHEAGLDSGKKATNRTSQDPDSRRGSPRSLQQHVNTLQNKTSMLEKALRSETLANEEQRTYIQILQNVIEQKLERDGILELLKEAIRKKKVQNQKLQARTQSPSNEYETQDEDPINLYVVLSDLKFQLESRTKENARITEHIKNQDEQIQELIKENQELYEIKTNQDRHTSEINKLSEQKEDLLDCVESQIKQIELLKHELHVERSKANESGSKQMHRSGSLERSENLQPSGLSEPQIQSVGLNPRVIVDQPNQVDQKETISADVSQTMVDLSYSHNGNTTVNQTMPPNNASGQHPQLHMSEHRLNSGESPMSRNSKMDNANMISQLSQQHLNEITRLRHAINQLEADLATTQQENDQIKHQNAMLKRQYEFEQTQSKVSDVTSAHKQLLDEQQRVDEISLSFEQKCRLMQREINLLKEQKLERESTLEQLQKSLERQVKENELKETQLESLKIQSQRDLTKVRDLTGQLEEAEFNLNRLTKEKERRESESMLETKNKELLSKEKHELVQNLNETQHQLQMIRTQNQTEKVRSDSQLEDQKSKVEQLQRDLKKQTSTNDMLQRELTETQVKLRKAEVQVSYLDKSGQQLMAEYKQTKLESEAEGRDKKRLGTQLADLQAENEQLYRNEERQRRLQEQVSQLQMDLKSKEIEIEKQDTKLRRAYIVKDELEVENTSLRKQLQTSQQEKHKYAQQKELLSGQQTDMERRLFDMTKNVQENEHKVRENAILVKDLQTERDKYKNLTVVSEDQIHDLNVQIKTLRTTNTDLKLMEEKLDTFLEEITAEIEKQKRGTRLQLQEFLNLAKNSESLANIVSVRQREEGHSLLDLLKANRPFVNDPNIIAEEFKTKDESLSHVWQVLQRIRDNVNNLGTSSHYIGEMLDLCMTTHIDIKGELTKRTRQVSNLENKLGSIHTVDFKAQEDSKTLKKDFMSLQQEKMDGDERHTIEVSNLNQRISELESSLDQVQTDNQELKQTLRDTQRKQGGKVEVEQMFNKTKREFENVKLENVKLQDLIARLQRALVGEGRPSQIVQEMLDCSLRLAQIESEKEEALQSVEQDEFNLASMLNDKGQMDSQQATKGDSMTLQFHTIKKIKDLRTQISVKASRVRDIDDQISFIIDKVKMLEAELARLSTMGNNLNRTCVKDSMAEAVNKYTGSGAHHNTQRETTSLSPPHRDDPGTFRGRAATAQTSSRNPSNPQRQEQRGQHDPSSQTTTFTHRNKDNNMLLDEHPIKEKSSETEQKQQDQNGPSQMTYSIEALLKETRDLRKQVSSKNTQIKNLESDLQKINTYSIMKFDETQSALRHTHSNYMIGDSSGPNLPRKRDEPLPPVESQFKSPDMIGNNPIRTYQQRL